MMSANNRDTQALLTKISEGDTEAFRVFYNAYYLRLRRYVCFFEMNLDQRNDILSDVLMNIWINRKKLLAVRNIESYLYICVRNQMLKYKSDMLVSHTVPLRLAENWGDAGQGNADHQMERQEIIDAVQGSIAQLPEKCRMIYLLIKHEKMSYHEVAKLLSISEKTVQAQMIIAVKKLGEAIRKIYKREDL